MPEKVRALIERLSASVDDDGAWTISSEDVAGILGIEQVRFWRTVHETRDRIAFADAIDGWSADSVGDLVTVLECLLGPGPEEMMARAGLFVPHLLGIELTEELLFRARRLAAAHEVRSDELAAMIRYAGSVRGAIEIYFNEHVDLDALVDGCAESFRVLQGLPSVGRATARRYLQRMFARHVLDRRALLAGLVGPVPMLLGFFMAGMAVGNLFLSYQNWVVTNTPHDRRPIYIGLFNTAGAVISLAAPIIGGTIAQQIGYEALFVVALLMALSALYVTLRYLRTPPLEAVHPAAVAEGVQASIAPENG